MRALRPGVWILLAVTLCGGPTTKVLAGELVVMPYTCNASAGKPRLAPSDDRGYQIIGRRQQRRFTKCSPTRRAHCRRWTIYRFDVDCNGTTVPWASIVAASEKKGRAWIENGRFVIRMPRSWTLDPNDPCARFSNIDQPRRFTPRERECAERLSYEPEPLVRMPPGFAPKFGMDAIFVESDEVPDRVAANMRTEPHDVAGSQEREPVELTPPVEQKPMPVPPVPAQHRTEPLPPPAADELQAEDTVVANAQSEETPSTEATAVAEAETLPEAMPGDASDKMGPDPVTIINAKEEAGQAQQNNKEPEPDKTTPETDHATKIVEVGAGLQQRTQEQEENETAPEKTELETNAEPLRFNDNENPLKYILLGLGAAGLMLITGWVLSRRNTPQPAKQSTLRDIASVSLTGNKLISASSSRELAPAQKKEPVKTEPELQAPPKKPPAIANTIGNKIPQSREDAFALLGNAVKPDANPAAIKKIVDGLRLSWHPDLAENDTDRGLRELRLKQINAAWDIISSAKASPPTNSATVLSNKNS